MANKSKKNSFFQGGPKGLILVAVIVLGSFLLLSKLNDYVAQVQQLSYSTFTHLVEKNEVKEITVSGNEVQGILTNQKHFETVIPENNPAQWETFKQHNVDIHIVAGSGQGWLWSFFPFLAIIILLLVVGGWFLLRQSRNQGNNSGSNVFFMGKSKAKLFMPSTIKENFDSVAGVAEAKEELKDIVDFLKNPEKYRRLGAQMTRGVLLIGEPGNGKTLLARAVAGEANCPFFSISGSDFIEVFVGVGAARVRDLFMQARKYAPSIIFIDEIDAVGRHRGTGLGGGNDEREQTLNQLLSEMDGFQTSGGSVIVLAATNRPDVLDKALLRPGRFDRRVEVPYPDLISREQILRVHAKGVKIDPTVDIVKIARGTPGFSGADLANLINEAALIASKTSQDTVTIKDFEEARDKILLGKEIKTIMLTDHERRVTAFHEAGHALTQLLMPADTDSLHKVTIIPRGRALGVTHSMPERERYTHTREELLASITSALGGRAAEELVFGTMTTGAYSDFKMATDIARRMVCLYGMSDALGMAIYGQQNGDFVYSQNTADKIDTEVKNLLSACHEKALGLLRDNRDKLDTLANTLLDKETLYAAEIYELLGIEPRQDHRFVQ